MTNPSLFSDRDTHKVCVEESDHQVPAIHFSQ